jgi:hypothetical protein
MVTIRTLVRACGPIGLSLGVMFSLGACAEVGGVVGTGLQTVQSAFGLEDTEEPVRQKPPKYCYRTLGDVTCYAQPLPAREANRLVGYEGPPPRSSSGTGPLIP